MDSFDFTFKFCLSHFAVLIYEPDNPEAQKFKPLIEEKIELGKGDNYCFTH